MVLNLIVYLKNFLSTQRWIGWLWTAIILILCLMPASDLPEEPFIPFFDKLIHIGIFAAWSFVWTAHYPAKKTMIALTGVALGLIIEFLQGAMGMGRSFEWWDLLADTCGVAAGIVAYQIIFRIGESKQ